METQMSARRGFLICIAGPSSAINPRTGKGFEGVDSCLRLLRRVGDVVELAPTNSRAARSEWAAAGLSPCDVLPERRRDAEICLCELMDRGNYEGRATLLIGCGASALRAARSRGAFFYPILPGFESRCWQELAEEGLHKFLHGTFSGSYQQLLIARHNSVIKE